MLRQTLSLALLAALVVCATNVGATEASADEGLKAPRIDYYALLDAKGHEKPLILEHNYLEKLFDLFMGKFELGYEETFHLFMMYSEAMYVLDHERDSYDRARPTFEKPNDITYPVDFNLHKAMTTLMQVYSRSDVWAKTKFVETALPSIHAAIKSVVPNAVPAKEYKDMLKKFLAQKDEAIFKSDGYLQDDAVRQKLASELQGLVPDELQQQYEQQRQQKTAKSEKKAHNSAQRSNGDLFSDQMTLFGVTRKTVSWTFICLGFLIVILRLIIPMDVAEAEKKQKEKKKKKKRK